MSTPNQRLRTVLLAVLGGTAIGVAIEQAGSSQYEVDGAIIEAAYLLRDLGHDVDELPSLVASVTGVGVDIVRPIVDRAVLASVRDPRAIRSEHLSIVVPVGDVTATRSAFGLATCAPLALVDALHTPCISVDHLGPGTDCAGKVLVEVDATPGQTQRVRDALGVAVVAVPSCRQDAGVEPAPDPNMSGG